MQAECPQFRAASMSSVIMRVGCEIASAANSFFCQAAADWTWKCPAPQIQSVEDEIHGGFFVIGLEDNLFEVQAP